MRDKIKRKESVLEEIINSDPKRKKIVEALKTKLLDEIKFYRKQYMAVLLLRLNENRGEMDKDLFNDICFCVTALNKLEEWIKREDTFYEIYKDGYFRCMTDDIDLMLNSKGYNESGGLIIRYLNLCHNMGNIVPMNDRMFIEDTTFLITAMDSLSYKKEKGTME